ncbi:hypothetical protein [Idiomarina xiamenensis]|nr:hypothetical protein [Idiomarina xiamenensis]
MPMPATPTLANLTVSQRPHFRILVIDDSDMTQLVLSDMLELLGHEVVQARSWLQAENAAQDQAFDIIFLAITPPQIPPQLTSSSIALASSSLTQPYWVTLGTVLSNEDWQPHEQLPKPLSQTHLEQTLKRIHDLQSSH